MRYRNTDAIILLGLNPTAPDEARALRSFGNEVMLITDGKRSDWKAIPDSLRKAADAVFQKKDGQDRSVLAEAARAVLGPACRAATSETSA